MDQPLQHRHGRIQASLHHPVKTGRVDAHNAIGIIAPMLRRCRAPIEHDPPAIDPIAFDEIEPQTSAKPAQPRVLTSVAELLEKRACLVTHNCPTIAP